jgi:hypothetical protein
MTIDPAEALKARCLAQLREELVYLINDYNHDSQIWRQGMLHGCMLELKELGIFDREGVDAFSMS